MKNKKEVNYRIYILIILIILLLSSTYAWFSNNKNVRINSLNVQVATAGNLEISADAINWKTEISKEELLKGYTNSTNQIPLKELYPTSTAGNISFGKLNMYYGQVILDNDTSQYEIVSSKETEQHGEKGKFIAFDIFLKVSQDTTIHLNSDSIIESAGLKNSNQSTGIENAVRIAFLNQGTGETSSQVQNLNGATSATIIEPNYDVHTMSGIQNAENIYKITGLRTMGNAALQYYGIKEIINEGRPLNDKSTTYFSIVNPQIKLEKSFFGSGQQKELFEIRKGITKIRVYMWIEGQDVDCEDNASGANLKFDLQFTT